LKSIEQVRIGYYLVCAMGKVSEFYKNKVILVTGGTGFCGKAIIEKLLRECSALERIYILLRHKKNGEKWTITKQRKFKVTQIIYRKFNAAI